MGQYKRILYGEIEESNVASANAMGRLITPAEIVEEVSSVAV